MITKYAEVVEIVRLLLLLLIVMPLFLMLSLIPSVASASSNSTITTIPEIVSDVSSSIQIAPILLAPIATSGNNVYIVWPSNQTGYLEIFFSASSDNGQTFLDKINLSNTPNVDSIDPQIATSGNHVYISWWEDYSNGTRVPSFTASNDNGRTFQSVRSLSDDGPIRVQDNNSSSINSAY